MPDPSLTIGVPLNLTPVAATIALLAAGAIPTTDVSPAPMWARLREPFVLELDSWDRSLITQPSNLLPG